ncbi:peptide/nickel transport system permease protein [Metamycoplasma subdolum]|uniref:Peptide/nickel transport system permease protein n=1 Tax=Metamycoplasma subdolum TaxID=92407 RepID=A0A3M0A2V7_9BACT|nr:ABC transporter permease subunit [Metamycoplasma subdolum]RMA78977.1 peptide/nickel transport system permease protein [Metamycoplasma subdolum]WPB50500.1 ABC transporter permease subunit [Metamycoplasma subdolum]
MLNFQNPSLFKFKTKKPKSIDLALPKTSTKMFWTRFFMKKSNIFALVFFMAILLTLLVALCFIKYSPTKSLQNGSIFVNNLPSYYSQIVKRNFERGAELDFIRQVAELEKNRAFSNGETPVFKILFDSAFDSGGSQTISTDIVTLYYNPYDLIKAINLNISSIPNAEINSQNFKPILGTNNDGIDIYSRLLSSIAVTLGIILLAIFFNIFVGFSLGALVALKKEKWYSRIIESFANMINAIPELLWIFLLCAFMGTNWYAILIAFSLISWSSFYEISKNETLALRRKEFVYSAMAVGLNQGQIIYFQLFRKIFPSLLILVTERLAINILIVSSLAFLDFITESNNLNIGTIFKEALSSIKTNFLYILVLTILVVSFSVSLKLFSNALAHAYNPVLK